MRGFSRSLHVSSNRMDSHYKNRYDNKHDYGRRRDGFGLLRQGKHHPVQGFVEWPQGRAGGAAAGEHVGATIDDCSFVGYAWGATRRPQIPECGVVLKHIQIHSVKMPDRL